MTKRILITGGAGFIGSNLSNELVKRGYDVTVLDNLNPQIHGLNPDTTSPLFTSLSDNITFIKGSVTDRILLENIIPDQQVIVHLAAETGTGQSMYEIEHYTAVNIGGTALLLDILANMPNDVQRMVIASSRAVYGEGKYLSKDFGAVFPEHRRAEDMSKGDFEVKYTDCESPLELVATDETSKIHPSSVYGITKQVQEQMVMTVCPTLGIQPITFRYQNVYGPGQSLSNPYTGILSIFSTRILQGKSINIFEDGMESRDFVYIDDVVKATILGIEDDKANGEVFNVGSGKPVTVIDVVNTLMYAYDVAVPVTISGNYRLGDIRHNYADLTKISETLGFKAKVSFKEGIRYFANWVKQQTIPVDKYDESLQEMKEKGLFQ